MKTCRVCANTNNHRSHIVCEMMFGYGAEFLYFECSKCGCLQIAEIPMDLSKFYNTDYYSFQASSQLQENIFIRFLKKQRMSYYIGQNNFLGALIAKLTHKGEYFQWLSLGKLNFASSILDVGCGSGSLLLLLKSRGFQNLLGVDPYLEEAISYPNGVKVLKQRLDEVNQQFDFVILSHSFEHMPDPMNALKDVYRIVKPGCRALLRIPIFPSFAWETYGVNWVQLDAPRHLFIHSKKSISILAKEAGFQSVDFSYDSTAFQFWGSEQYLHGIPLISEKSYLCYPEASIFSREQIDAFEAKAKILNAKETGDQVCVYLHKAK
jgi:2-polyprenyl-3-methyl-5-hydroxy-6-metoxy-1,4-benzoquinol methylase